MDLFKKIDINFNKRFESRASILSISIFVGFFFPIILFSQNRIEILEVFDSKILIGSGETSGVEIGLQGNIMEDIKYGKGTKNLVIAEFKIIQVDPRSSTAMITKIGKVTKIQPYKHYVQFAKPLIPLKKGPTVPKAIDTYINPQNDSKMIYIPGGTYNVGRNNSLPDEKPEHRVTISPFYIDQYEITNLKYNLYIEKIGGIKPKYYDNADYNLPNYPVVGISWNEATDYCKMAAGGRLPTEAEWEIATGESKKNLEFNSNFEEANFKKQGNFSEFSAIPNINPTKSQFSFVPISDGFLNASPVGSFEPNKYSLYDMKGNALEWVSDWYQEDYYSITSPNNPKGPETGEFHVAKGGAWFFNINDSYASKRYIIKPNSRLFYLGFRCVKDQK